MTSASTRAAKRRSSCALGPGVMPIVYMRLSFASVIASSLRLVHRLRLLARRVHARPGAHVFLGELHDLVEIQPAGDGEHHVARAVAAA